ncbi:hypothetical protein L0F63_006911, partial [Massospora cicadina]
MSAGQSNSLGFNFDLDKVLQHAEDSKGASLDPQERGLLGDALKAAMGGSMGGTASGAQQAGPSGNGDFASSVLSQLTGGPSGGGQPGFMGLAMGKAMQMLAGSGASHGEKAGMLSSVAQLAAGMMGGGAATGGASHGGGPKGGMAMMNLRFMGPSQPAQVGLRIFRANSSMDRSRPAPRTKPIKPATRPPRVTARAMGNHLKSGPIIHLKEATATSRRARMANRKATASNLKLPRVSRHTSRTANRSPANRKVTVSSNKGPLGSHPPEAMGSIPPRAGMATYRTTKVGITLIPKAGTAPILHIPPELCAWRGRVHFGGKRSTGMQDEIKLDSLWAAPYRLEVKLVKLHEVET